MSGDMKVVNLFAGPGAGKSTTAAGLFYRLKCLGQNVELVTEAAKDHTWEDNRFALNNQLVILGEQDRRLDRLRGKVDLVINDSPLLLSELYASGRFTGWIGNSAFKAYQTYENLNFFIKRSKPYSPIGRSQSFFEAKQIDIATENLLGSRSVAYEQVRGMEAVDHILARLEPYIDRSRPSEH